MKLLQSPERTIVPGKGRGGSRASQPQYLLARRTQTLPFSRRPRRCWRNAAARNILRPGPFFISQEHCQPGETEPAHVMTGTQPRRVGLFHRILRIGSAHRRDAICTNDATRQHLALFRDENSYLPVMKTIQYRNNPQEFRLWKPSAVPGKL